MSTLIANILQGINTVKRDASTTAMTIDSNGVVTRNTLPAWMIQLTGDQNFTTADTWNTITDMTDNATNSFIQGGITLSSGVITVPVAGAYHVSFQSRVDVVGTGYVWVMISINNSDLTQVQFTNLNGGPNSAYHTLPCSGVYNLSANDNLRCKIYTSSDTSYHTAQQTHFSGFLIG